MQWSQNLCRICGQISETCHSIFHNDVLSALEDKIKKCLNLNLCKGDYKPKQICNICVTKLNDFSEFLDTCYATNQKFESIYLNSQTWENRNYEYPPCQKQSVIVSNKQMPDNLDLELYKNTGIVLENISINNCQLNDADVLELVDEGNYNTKQCSVYTEMKAKSPYTTVLRHHSHTEYIPSNYPRQDAEHANDNNNKICYINNSYNSNNSSTELKNVEDNPNRKTVTVDAIQKSLSKTVNKPCTKEKPKKMHSCPHCHKSFSRRGTLNSHIATHTNIRPYTCENCSKSFAVKSELTTHKKVHGDQHKCMYCPKKFPVPSKLKRHIRIHTEDKPFACNFANCGKSFSDKRNLDGHKLMHTSEKNFQCSICMKLFKTASRLKQHSKSHFCGLMYTCDLCSKKYKYKSNLISHIKKHNNICPYCKVNYGSNTVLTNHIKICRARL